LQANRLPGCCALFACLCVRQLVCALPLLAQAVVPDGERMFVPRKGGGWGGGLTCGWGNNYVIYSNLVTIFLILTFPSLTQRPRHAICTSLGLPSAGQLGEVYCSSVQRATCTVCLGTEMSRGHPGSWWRHFAMGIHTAIAIGGRVPAVLLNSPSTRKDGRLGGATIHTNVKSLTQFYHAAVLA